MDTLKNYFLETDLINMPSRHRSVHAAIDGSWQKLAEEQKRPLTRLSTLKGSFTREAAKAIAGVSLRDLTYLINKSFVRKPVNVAKRGI